MAESVAISAHGTIVKRNGVAIAELRDLTPPALTRKPIETTMHNSDDDSYVVGIRRKGEMQFQLGFLNTETTHNSTTGLLKAWLVGSKDEYTITFPDGGIWLFSGFVSQIGLKQPVDGGQEAAISIRPSGGQTITP